MNQPCTEQTIRDNEQLAELEAMYEQTERALVLIGDRMREIKNRLQKKPPVEKDYGTYFQWATTDYYNKLAGGKYEK